MTQQQLALPGFAQGYEHGRAEERAAIVALLSKRENNRERWWAANWAERIERGEHLNVSTALALC